MSAFESMQGFLGCSFIAALTWFFSDRPRLFIRVFVPREDLWSAGRNILRSQSIRAMRIMALVQFVVALIFGAIGLCRFLA